MNAVVLILIDDDVQVLAALRRLLQHSLTPTLAPRTLSVESYTDPRAALERMRERSPDLVICDYRMPGLDGVTVLRQLAQTHPDTARIMLTGSPDLLAVLEAINGAGVSRVLLKPWANAELLRAVGDCLLARDDRLTQRHLADQASMTSCTLTAQEAERRRLEAQWPGITHVEWTDDGAVQFGDTGLSPLDVLPHNAR